MRAPWRRGSRKVSVDSAICSPLACCTWGGQPLHAPRSQTSQLNAVKLLQFTVLELCLVFALFSHKVIQPLLTERPAVRSSKLIELDDEESAVRPLAKFVGVGLSLRDHQTFLYSARAPRLGFEGSFSLKKRTPSSSMMKIGGQSRNVTRTGLDGGVRAATRSGARWRTLLT